LPDVTFEELGLDVAGRLDRAGIPYMLTGALAVNYHGAPRSTHDIDVVGVISPADITRIKAMLEPDYEVAEESIRAALREGSMFNAIHDESGFKVDFWMRKGDDYGREAFARRKQYPYDHSLLSIATPEDVIISKLDWFKQSDVDKHFSDARGIVAIQKGSLDTAYIARWCEAKSLLDLWCRLQRDAAC
jgi:hypothetical protein